MINKKTIFNIIYALAIFAVVFACAQLLISAIQYTRALGLEDRVLSISKFKPFSWFLIAAYWIGFGFSFITLLSMFLSLFWKNKFLKIFSKVMLVTTVVSLIVLASLSFHWAVVVISYNIDNSMLTILDLDFVSIQELVGFFTTMIVGLLIIFGIDLIEHFSNKKQKSLLETEKKTEIEI